MSSKSGVAKPWRILAIGAAVSIGIVVVSICLLHLIPEGRFLPEVVLTIQLISGILALVLVLAATAVIFSKLNLGDSDQAFGLPEGSIRATIALGLLLIFSIISVFLYSQLSLGRTSLLEGLSEEQFQTLDLESVYSSSQVKHQVVASDNGQESFVFYYDVRLRLKPTENGINLAEQLLTTLSTLVVAVAGFYFGSRAISTSRPD